MKICAHPPLATVTTAPGSVPQTPHGRDTPSPSHSLSLQCPPCSFLKPRHRVCRAADTPSCQRSCPQECGCLVFRVWFTPAPHSAGARSPPPSPQPRPGTHPLLPADTPHSQPGLILGHVHSAIQKAPPWWCHVTHGLDHFSPREGQHPFSMHHLPMWLEPQLCDLGRLLALSDPPSSLL